MPVIAGPSVGQFNLTIQHVSNGDPANQSVFRSPSINLENRTDALRAFADAQEVLRNAQVGASAQSIGGVQGAHNTSHHHTGTDGSFLLDFQQLYNNDSDNADFALAAGGTFAIKSNAGETLLQLDNDTEAFTIKTWAENSIPDSALDWGSQPNQINLDKVPDGTVTGKLSKAKQIAYDTHLTNDATSAHSLKLQAKPLKPNNATALDGHIDVSTLLTGETAGGNATKEGLVTDAPNNLAIIKIADSFEDITDNFGNKVYGRLTESSGVFTLTFYSNISGIETPFSFLASQSISWWIQKVYSLSNIPVWDSAFQVSSDEVAGLRRQRQPNLIVNGNFDFKGAGSINASDATVLKRWTAHWSGFTTSTFEHQAAFATGDTPDVATSGFRSFNSYQLTSTGIQAAMGAAAILKVRHTLRGQDLQNLGNGYATLTFWVRSEKTGTYSICLKNRLMNRSYVTQYTVNQSGVFERKSIILNLSGLDTGSWDFDGAASAEGMFIDFVCAAGSSQRTATVDAWANTAAGEIFASTNQVNVTDDASVKFNLAQVSLRRGIDPGALFERAGTLYDVEAIIV